jgi:hypothetical protein
LMWGSLLFQSLVVSFASYLAWFWLLRHYWASRLGVFSFMTPLFGIAFGVWLLDEPLEASFLIGAILVLAGVTLVSGDDGWKALLGRVIRPVESAWTAGASTVLRTAGWYSGSGWEAVEIALASGKCLRLGTDEPQRLTRALLAAKREQGCGTFPQYGKQGM